MMKLYKFQGINNRLLLSLPQTTLKRLKPSLEFRAMPKGDVIASADRPIEYVYFVNSGLISLVKTMEDGRSIEIGLVGTEGCSGLHAVLGLNIAILDATVQMPGTAFRIKRNTLAHFIVEDEALSISLQKYAHFAFAAIAQTGACNRLHRLEERLCRWLLIAHDSALTDSFDITHEYLAIMLGSQRAAVSVTANKLQKSGVIYYRYGKITIRNRAALEEAACECYGDMQAKFDKLFPITKRSGIR